MPSSPGQLLVIPLGVGSALTGLDDEVGAAEEEARAEELGTGVEEELEDGRGDEELDEDLELETTGGAAQELT